MKISVEIDELREQIENCLSSIENPTIGFVPTMGALHEGHLSLIKAAREQSDIVVCSIFVNPTQFNNAADLERYPRDLDSDVKLLQENGCDVVFAPTEEVIYPDGEPDYQIDFNGLDQVMEGPNRPGHFKGVAMVVQRLFEIVRPDKGFFGLKDFQQVAILKQMVKIKGLNVEIIPMPIVRSGQGLALSSRNQLLSEKEKELALIIFETLSYGKRIVSECENGHQLQQKMIEFFEAGELELEYLEIVDNDSLQPIDQLRPNISCCIAAYCGQVRLIDNMQFL